MSLPKMQLQEVGWMKQDHFHVFIQLNKHSF